MLDERQFAELLKQSGFTTGCSKRGRLLRLDGRGTLVDLNSDCLEQILQCSALRELYLPHAKDMLNGYGEELLSLAALKVLDLEGSDFNDDAVLQLVGHPHLQVLNVRSTRVTADCVAGLRKVMIGTRIIF